MLVAVTLHYRKAAAAAATRTTPVVVKHGDGLSARIWRRITNACACKTRSTATTGAAAPTVAAPVIVELPLAQSASNLTTVLSAPESPSISSEPTNTLAAQSLLVQPSHAGSPPVDAIESSPASAAAVTAPADDTGAVEERRAAAPAHPTRVHNLELTIDAPTSLPASPAATTDIAKRAEGRQNEPKSSSSSTPEVVDWRLKQFFPTTLRPTYWYYVHIDMFLLLSLAAIRLLRNAFSDGVASATLQLLCTLTALSIAAYLFYAARPHSPGFGWMRPAKLCLLGLYMFIACLNFVSTTSAIVDNFKAASDASGSYSTHPDAGLATNLSPSMLHSAEEALAVICFVLSIVLYSLLLVGFLRSLLYAEVEPAPTPLRKIKLPAGDSSYGGDGGTPLGSASRFASDMPVASAVAASTPGPLDPGTPGSPSASAAVATPSAQWRRFF